METIQKPKALSRTESPPSRSAVRVPAVKRPLAASELLAAKLERAIRRGTNDRVRGLIVEVLEEGVVLNGRCGTFYCKSLAQQAVKGLIGQEQLFNRIEVW